MSDKRFWLLAAAATALIVDAGIVAAAQSTSRIVCWKDESGKVVGCGDRVPPEYRGSATKELDTRGITRKTTETPEEAAKRRAEAQERARQEAEERRRLAEERRQDRALLATYAPRAAMQDFIVQSDEQFVFLLEGHVRTEFADGRELELRPGDSATFVSGEGGHRHINLADEVSRMVIVIRR